MTSQQYQMNLFEESEVRTLSVEDFRAKLSQLQETDRRIYKMKRLGIIIGAVFVIVVSPFVVQYGWNEIITTIVPVGKITVWQALGMDALLSFIWPVLSSKKESEEDYSYAVKSSISKIITCAFLIWLASLFI